MSRLLRNSKLLKDHLSLVLWRIRMLWILRLEDIWLLLLLNVFFILGSIFWKWELKMYRKFLALMIRIWIPLRIMIKLIVIYTIIWRRALWCILNNVELKLMEVGVIKGWFNAFQIYSLLLILDILNVNYLDFV